MRNIFVLMAVIFCKFSFAQQQSGFNRGGMASSCKVTGKVLDAEKKNPQEFAVIKLFKSSNDSLITGTTTNINGDYILDNIVFGKYKITVEALGKQKYVSDEFFLLPNAKEKQMNNIFLATKSQVLNQVKITAEKEALQNNLDKRVFNVDKNLASAGGTANDVLRQVPGVNVDMDGKVSLRGSENITILIDGRPSGLLGDGRKSVLANLPANIIESVELVTNPGAKYSAEGMGGIINITLKKNKAQGFSGSINANAGTRDKYGAGINLNYRKKRFNFYGSYNYRNDYRIVTGYSYRTNIFNDSSHQVNQDNIGYRKEITNTIRAGVDYEINAKTVFGISSSLSLQNELNPEDIDYQILNINNITLQDYVRYNVTKQTRNSLDYGINFTKQLNMPKEEFSASINFSNFERNNIQDYNSDFLTYQLLQQNKSIGKVFITSSQADYTYPISKVSRIEAGAKLNTRSIDADNVFYNQDINKDWIKDANISNHLLFDELISAAYSTYSNVFKTFVYQVGLRGELTRQNIFLKNNNFFHQNRYINFFPSALIKQPLSKNRTLQLSYTRRVNRPDYQALSPFLDVSDPQNRRIGNPALLPELINSTELGFQKNWDNHNFTTNIYWKHSNNLVVRYRKLNDDGSSMITMTNGFSSDNYGLEFTSKHQINKVDILANINLFESKINARNIEADLQNENFNWFAKLNIGYKFIKTAVAQFSLNYNSPILLAQGKMQENFVIGLALKKDFLKNRLNITINANDLLDQQRMEFETGAYNFKQLALRKRESRVLMLTAIYKLGSSNDNSTSKKKGMRTDMPTSNDAGGDF